MDNKFLKNIIFIKKKLVFLNINNNDILKYYF